MHCLIAIQIWVNIIRFMANISCELIKHVWCSLRITFLLLYWSSKNHFLCYFKIVIFVNKAPMTISFRGNKARYRSGLSVLVWLRALHQIWSLCSKRKWFRCLSLYKKKSGVIGSSVILILSQHNYLKIKISFYIKPF